MTTFPPLQLVSDNPPRYEFVKYTRQNHRPEPEPPKNPYKLKRMFYMSCFGAFIGALGFYQELCTKYNLINYEQKLFKSLTEEIGERKNNLLRYAALDPDEVAMYAGTAKSVSDATGVNVSLNDVENAHYIINGDNLNRYTNKFLKAKTVKAKMQVMINYLKSEGIDRITAHKITEEYGLRLVDLTEAKNKNNFCMNFNLAATGALFVLFIVAVKLNDRKESQYLLNTCG